MFKIEEIDTLIEQMTNLFEADDDERYQKAAELLDTVPELAQSTTAELNSLPDDKVMQYAQDGVEFARHRYLSTPPGDFTRKLIEDLIASVYNETLPPKIRFHAANCVMETASLVQPDKKDSALCTLEQLKFFVIWFNNNKEEVQDV